MRTSTSTELDKNNIFEQIFSFMDFYKINSIYIEIILSLERLLQDVDDEYLSKIVMDKLSVLTENLKNYGIAFENNDVSGALNTFYQSHKDLFVRYFSIISLISEIIKIGDKEKEINKSIEQILSIDTQILLNYGNQIQTAITDISGLSKRRNKKISSKVSSYMKQALHFSVAAMNATNKSHVVEYYDELNWVISIKFNNSNINKISFFLWTFSEIVESIEGITLTLVSLEMGSVFAKFKIKFNDLFIRDEFAQIGDNLQNGLYDSIVLAGESVENQFHTKPIAETNKIIGETEKIHEESKKISIETKAIERELIGNIDPETEKNFKLFERQIDLEAKELDNQRKRIENFNMALDTKKKMSDMLKDSIIEQDDIEININNLLFILKVDHKIIKGCTIDEIIQLSKNKPDDKELPVEK